MMLLYLLLGIKSNKLSSQPTEQQASLHLVNLMSLHNFVLLLNPVSVVYLESMLRHWE